MSLAARIVCSAAVPVVLLIGTARMILRAVEDSGAESRRELARIGPATRGMAVADETRVTLDRLHGRWVVLRDPAYERLWGIRVAELDRQLSDLRSSLDGRGERRLLRKARHAFDRYRSLATTPGDDGAALRPPSVADRDRIGKASERVRRALAGVGRELESSAQRAESDATAVERLLADAMVAVDVLAIGIALLLSAWTARRIVVGLHRLTEASVALERGRLDQPIALGGRDEVGRLAAAFEALALELRERDRVGEETLQRIGRDLGDPLLAVRDATRLLANESVGALDARQHRLVEDIREAAEQLLRRVAHIGEGGVPRSRAPIALEHPAPRLLAHAFTIPDEPR